MNKVTIVTVFFGFLFIGAMAVLAATTPSLGLATTYGVLASTYTDTSAATTVTGDVGFTTPPASAIAGVHANYGSGVPYATAGIDQGSALVNLNLQADDPSCMSLGPVATLNAVTIPGGYPMGTFPPGCYKTDTAMLITLGTTVTLSGAGTYIFRPGGALTTGANSQVVLTNGASACDVFWAPVGATTLGANAGPSILPTFVGTIFDDAGITIGHFANLLGRALAFGGTVTTDANTITVPICAAPATFHVVKQVVNAGGGTAIPANFSLHVKSAGVEVVGSPAVGSGVGTTYSLIAGTYAVSEDANASYTTSFSGDCNIGGSIVLASGENKTCTVTNTYIVPAAATLHVIKLVVNGSGGTAIASNFMVHVKNAGVDVTGSPAAGAGGLGTAYSLAAGTYIVSEDANASYTQSFTGDCNSSGSITLLAGADKICTVVNTNIPVVNSSSGSSGGGGGGNYVSRVPLIGILKVPTPLALPSSGSVVYNYTVWNVGDQSLVDVTVVDDKCFPLVLQSGDLNHNSKLDTSEKWKYSCSTTLSETTTNTAIATGYSPDSYHQAAIATATATVVVGPSLTTPPLISIVKVPSRLTPFPIRGGNVIYKYTVTNPGVVAIHSVVVTDDKCSPISQPFGDMNHNGLLEPNETWTYICRMHISRSVRNIATAKGSANGFTAISHAFATVLVSPTPTTPTPTPTPNQPTPTTPTPTPIPKPTPHFPNTGFAPQE